ncbi:50S ribosomal protein L6 [Candidatus Pacearchaeota archaeon]|nr:50S ribosomal protein L6 [Candidatus Pacearchaeota archaeon]
MKKDITETIEIPEGIGLLVEGDTLILKKGGEENKKILTKQLGTKVSMRKEDSKIIFEAMKATKRELKIINTIRAHIKNMIQGLDKKFIYKLKVCSVHFPIAVSKEGKNILIKNFLGESKLRKAKILDNVDVKIEKDVIKIESFNKEAAGQTAANIEKTTMVRAKDRRVFQDGIFITEKYGKEI